MSNANTTFRTEFAQRQKAKKFIREYYTEHGEMPDAEAVNEAKILTPEEVEKINFDVQVNNVVEESKREVVANWDYIWNEETWNAAYNKENSSLKEYLDAKPDEDRYNYNEGRPAQARDKVDGEWPDYCPQCWEGAIKAPGAKYPWCVVNIEPFVGNIKFNYDGGEDVFPWGTADRTFRRHYAIASIPVELGDEFLLDENGNTTFEPEKLTVTLLYA